MSNDRWPGNPATVALTHYVGPASDQFSNQLYIDPDDCIDCQACEPVCPWEAPLRETQVPPVFTTTSL